MMSDAGVKGSNVGVANGVVSNPNGLTTVYSNNVGVAATLIDFTLFFTEAGQMLGEKGPIARNELKAAVTLPIAIAPAVLASLRQMLAAHDQMTKNQKPAVTVNAQGGGRVQQ